MTDSYSSNIINHEGVVLSNNGSTVIISISSEPACSGCHAEGSCSLSGKEKKTIEVQGKYEVKSGEQVTILMKQSMGYIALFLGYLLPGIAVVTVLITMISIKVPELFAGLISLAILLPYYILLFFLRARIDKKFTFTLKV
jgi:sigma-E factor negative regulatory protein RseC